MTGQYLIQLVEDYCRETGRNISEVYDELGINYQDTYGPNIVKEMRDNKQHDIVKYLENKGLGFIDRYVKLLNKIIKLNK